MKSVRFNPASENPAPESRLSSQDRLLLIALMGSVGWARPARLLRGVMLGGKERHYVLAAQIFGGSGLFRSCPDLQHHFDASHSFDSAAYPG